MKFEINYEGKEDLYRKVVMLCGISNLVNTFYEMIDAKSKEYGIDEFDDIIDMMHGGQNTITWFAALCVNNDINWYDVNKHTFTLEEAKEVIEIENSINDIVFGKGGKS